MKIRREKKQGGPQTFSVIKTHRQLGPVLSVIGITGFVSGLILIVIDIGTIFIFRLHFMTGLGVSLFIAITYSSSRRIRGRDSVWRTPHLALGILLLTLYLIQIFLGIGILF